MLSEQQVAAFFRNGFLHIPNAISTRELKGIKEVVEGFMADPNQQPLEVRQDFKYGALIGDNIGKGNQLCRIEYTFNKHPRFLMMLANPHILDVAASLYQSPVVVTWEDMVIKIPGTSFSVPFHQDLLFQSTKKPVFSIGIYLDDSNEDPLLVLPGTQQLGPLSEVQIQELVKERANEIVRMPVKAGDLLVHNVLMVHGSNANISNKLRRVVYFEFRTVLQVLNDSPWNESWLQKRMQFIPAAIKLREQSDLVNEDDLSLRDELYKHRDTWLPQVPLVQTELQLRVHHDPALS